MRQHIPILGWCFIIYSSLIAVIGLFVGVILLGSGAASGDRHAMVITGTIGVAVTGFLLVLSLPGIIAGAGLLKLRPWARILAIIIGALHLLSFPFGTALGIYTLYVLLNADVQALFEGQRAVA